MPKYEVKAPDGKLFDVNAPEGASEADAIAYVQKQFYGSKQVDMPAPDKGFGEKVSDALGMVPRQLGLTARAAIQGPLDVLDTLASPIRYGLNKAGMNIQGRTGNAVSDAIGLPVPQTTMENVAGKGAEFMAGGVLPIGLASKAAPLTTGATRGVLDTLSASPGMQTASALGAGTSGEYVKQTGGGPLAQFAASVIGGLAAPAAVGAGRAAASKVGSLIAPKPQNVDIAIQSVIDNGDYGIKYADIGNRVKAQLRDDVSKAMSSGSLDKEALGRLIDYRMVGATPRRGSLTLDPAQVSRERNLEKIGVNSNDATLQGLAKTSNDNNRVFIQNLNDLGGNVGDSFKAGSSAIGAISARDAAAKAAENELYKAARDSSGRAIPLDRDHFLNSAYEALAKENKGAFLPESIQSLLNQIRTGTTNIGGKSYEIPFNVDVIDNLKTTLASASRGATDGNARAAIAIVRDSLENTPIKAVGRSLGGSRAAPDGVMSAMQGKADNLGQEAIDAFNEARVFARNRRAWQESSPAISDALDGVAPDRFIDQYIIGNTGKSSVADVAKLKDELARSPQALQQTKEAIVAWLKREATSNANGDDVAKFSQSGFNKAMMKLGDGKLSIFFSPDEITKLKALGRVASYEQFQPVGSAVNNSNSGALALAGALDFVANNKLLSRVPGGHLVRVPAANWAAQMNTKSALNAPLGLLATEAEQTKAIPLGLLMAPLISSGSTTQQ